MLIVDDESVIALELEFAFIDAGAVVIGPASDIEHASLLAANETLSAAVLDMRLGSRSIEPVAEILTRSGIPFVFYSGQAPGDSTRSRWPNTRFIPKPASSHRLIETIADLVARSATPSSASCHDGPEPGSRI